MAAAVSVGSELLLGSLLGGATDAAISLACGEQDTNELLHDFADGAIDGFMFTGIFAPIGAAGAVSRYAKNAEGFKVNWGGDIILQYHPADASHHGSAYFKISSGETGTIRIDLN